METSDGSVAIGLVNVTEAPQDSAASTVSNLYVRLKHFLVRFSQILLFIAPTRTQPAKTQRTRQVEEIAAACMCLNLISFNFIVDKCDFVSYAAAAKGNEQHPSENKQQRRSQGAGVQKRQTFHHRPSSRRLFFLPFSHRSTLSFEPAKLPTQPRTSPEKRGSGKTLAEPGSSEQTKDVDVAREELEGGGSKVKAKAAVSRR